MNSNRRKDTEKSVSSPVPQVKDPLDAITAIEIAQAENRPLDPSVAAWLTEGFRAYLEEGVSLEYSFGAKAGRGETSPLKKQYIDHQIQLVMAEIAHIHISENKSVKTATEMVEGRMVQDMERGLLRPCEAYTYDVLKRHWYSRENQVWREACRDSRLTANIAKNPFWKFPPDRYPSPS